jgi:hypothetical protein
MKTSSLKAKARVLQDKVVKMYQDVLCSEIYKLHEDDIKPAVMGQTGVDVIFSPAARALFDHIIECKKHAAVRIPFFFADHYKKYKDVPGLKLLFSENNRSEPLVTMRAEDFMVLFEELLNLQAKDS